MLCSLVEIYQSTEVLVKFLISQRRIFYKDYLFNFYLHNQMMQITPDTSQQLFLQASTIEIGYVYETLNTGGS
jgi:hypothetical protein